MKSKLTLFLIATLIIVPLIFLGCKTQDTTEFEERIAELEGKLAEEETEIVEEEIPEVEEVTEESPTEEVTEEEELEEETETDLDTVKEAPTISLAIYEGPTLDGSICYYRVEATVTGSPSPTVSFSKDDSGGAWGSKKTQVNLNDPTDTYTLTATASNLEGSATDSITLNWGCEVPEPDPDPDPDPDPGPVEKDVDIGADTNISGYIEIGYTRYQGAPYLQIGDFYDIGTIAFLSFDISSIISLDDVTIKDVSVSIPINKTLGMPEVLGPLNIYVFYYGNSLDGPIPLIGGELVKTINTTYFLTDFNFSSNELKDELQKRVDKGKYLFQLKLKLSTEIVSSFDSDHYVISTSDVAMHIKYEIPE